MLEVCEKDLQEQQEYLEESYKTTCFSLMKNEMLLKNVEDGIVALDPSESIDHVKSIIASLSKNKGILEKMLKKTADAD